MYKFFTKYYLWCGTKFSGWFLKGEIMKIKKFFGKRFILALIFLMNSTLFANFESDTFSKIFKEYTLRGNDIISNFIDSIYFGGIILYRGISFKISQIFGYILLFFMIINILSRGKILVKLSRRGLLW